MSSKIKEVKKVDVVVDSGAEETTRPVPNPIAEANALASMGGVMPENSEKNKTPKGERPAKNAKAEAKAEKKAEAHGDPVYAVPDGVEIQSLRGLLKAGDEVLPRYLRGGVKVLVELVSKGILVKK